MDKRNRLDTYLADLAKRIGAIERRLPYKTAELFNQASNDRQTGLAQRIVIAGETYYIGADGAAVLKTISCLGGNSTNWNAAYAAAHTRGHGLFTALDHTDVGTYLSATNPLLETSGPQFAKLGIGKPADAFRDATYTPQIILPPGGYADADLFAPVDGESGVLTIDGTYYYPYMVFVAIDANTLTGPVHARPPNDSIAITTKTYNYSRSGGTVTVTPVAGEPPGISVHAVGTMIMVSLTDSYTAGYDDPGAPPYNIPPYTGSYPTAERMMSHTIDHANISAHAVSSSDDALLSVAGGGRFAGIINMETHRLTGLAAPTTAGDAIRQTAAITEAALGTALGYLDQSVKVAGTPQFARVGIGTAAEGTVKLFVMSTNSIAAVFVNNNGSTRDGFYNGDEIGFHIRPYAGKHGALTFTEDTVADRWAIGILDADANLYFCSGGSLATSPILTLSPTNLLNAGTEQVLRLGIGVAAHATSQLNIASSAGAASIPISTYSVTASHSSNIFLTKSANATIGTLGATAATELFGQIISQGVNSSNALATGSLILFAADGAPGATYIPSKISFYTGTNAAGVTEKMILDNAGKLTLTGDFAHTGTNFGVCNTAPHAQIAHVADATDASTVITRCNAILATLEAFGFHAAA